jgi:hypothetical protein
MRKINWSLVILMIVVFGGAVFVQQVYESAYWNACYWIPYYVGFKDPKPVDWCGPRPWWVLGKEPNKKTPPKRIPGVTE